MTYPKDPTKRETYRQKVSGVNSSVFGKHFHRSKPIWNKGLTKETCSSIKGLSGSKNGMFGKHPSEETIKKTTHKGSDNGMFGKSVYDVWVEKYGIDVANTKIKERNEKIKKSNIGKNKGKHRTEETKQKLREANTGKHHIGHPHTEETKRKIGDIHRGKTISEEQKTKTVKTITNRYAFKFFWILCDKELNFLSVPLCACGCGQYVTYNKYKPCKFISGHSARVYDGFKGKHHTEEIRKKLSEKRKDDVGEKSHNWKGGLSLEPYPIIFNNRLKEHIRNKYNRTCFLCYKSETEMKEKLHIHHIDYNKKNNSEDNLVALCTSCHLKTNGHRIFWQQYFEKLLLPDLTFVVQSMITINN